MTGPNGQSETRTETYYVDHYGRHDFFKVWIPVDDLISKSTRFNFFGRKRSTILEEVLDCVGPLAALKLNLIGTNWDCLLEQEVKRKSKID